jgi:hypothetical protein
MSKIFEFVNEDTNNDDFKFEYINMDHCSGLVKGELEQNNGGFQLIKINTNENQIENEICFHSICIPVKPNCMPNCIIGKHVCLTQLGEFVINPCDD